MARESMNMSIRLEAVAMRYVLHIETLSRSEENKVHIWTEHVP